MCVFALSRKDRIFLIWVKAGGPDNDYKNRTIGFAAMSNSQKFLEDARTCFRRAAEAIETKSMLLFADMGREYLRMAHEAAALSDGSRKSETSPD